MKIDFIADTNILIYVHEGNEYIKPFLEYDFGISFVSEVELLGYNKITPQQDVKLRKLIQDCYVVDWNTSIKEITIELRRKYKIKSSPGYR